MTLQRLSGLSLLAIAVALAATTLLAPAPAQANGCITPAAGTALDPFLIATEGNLDCLVGNDSYYWGHGYHFRQTADLDMSGYAAWTLGIGSAAIPFNGTYDGNGFRISNLTISSSGNGVGLFGVTTGAALKNITVSNLQVTGERQVGGLVGVLDGGSVEDVAIAATVTGTCSNPGFNCYVGGLVGLVDDSAATTIATSWTSGSATAPAYGRGAGGLIGGATPSTLTVTDSYSDVAVTGYNYVGGLIGAYVESTGSEVLSVTDSYASGPVVATAGSADDGGVVGCFYDNQIFNQCDAPYGTANVTDTFWDTQTTGQATTAANLGRGKTTAQMTDLATFNSWSIDDTTPSPSTTWGICSALNSGYPFLQWYAEKQSWTCTPPTPPDPTPAQAPIPATPPLDVQATPGNSLATITWSPPASSGSYAVSTYMVTSSPDSRMCLTTEATCAVTGLRNGVSYTFTVQALTGAGWSPKSEASNAVTPTVARSIVIDGQRTGRTVSITGMAHGFSGQSLTIMVRLRGESTYSQRGIVTPNAQGTFTWSMRTRKTVYTYVEGAGVASNRAIINR